MAPTRRQPAANPPPTRRNPPQTRPEPAANPPQTRPRFAKFEEMCKEDERARAIYKFALDSVPKAQAEELYRQFVVFEKQHGNREGIEDVVVSKARLERSTALQAASLARQRSGAMGRPERRTRSA